MSYFRHFFFVFMCLFTKLIILSLNQIMSNNLVFAYLTLYIHYLFIRGEVKTEMQFDSPYKRLRRFTNG